MNERPQQPPEGKLLADALEASGLSIREASRRAGISYGRWRQITSGVQNVSPGSYAKVTGPAKTVARMAAVVDVTPGQMENEGQRPDAAAELRKILDREESVQAAGHAPAVSGRPGPLMHLIEAIDSVLVDDAARIQADIEHGRFTPVPGILAETETNILATSWPADRKAREIVRLRAALSDVTGESRRKAQLPNDPGKTRWPACSE